MRSNTFVPLLQFTDWMGFQGWRAAGFDRFDQQGSTVVFNNNVQQDNDACVCILQHPWDSKRHWSRDELIDVLALGEQVFLEEVGMYPAPQYIHEERHQYNKSRLYKPHYPCGEKIRTGRRALLNLGLFNLVRTDGLGQIQDNFLVTGSVPINDNLDRIRMFFRSTDCYSECLNFQGVIYRDPNDRSCEIRPFECLFFQPNPALGTLSFVFSAPAYLFKRPDLESVTTCLDHELDSYVDQVELWQEVDFPCEQGQLVCQSSPCYGDCEEFNYPVCFNTKLIHKQDFLEPLLRQCRLDSDGTIVLDGNGDPIFDTYCLNCLPTEVQINYVTGAGLTKDRLVQPEIAEVIFLLAIGLASCIKDWCECDVCSSRRMEWYRSPDMVLIKDQRVNRDYDRIMQVLTSKYAINNLDGLYNNRALQLAMRKIKKLKCHSGGLYT